MSNASATPGANIVAKCGGGGKLALGFLPTNDLLGTTNQVSVSGGTDAVLGSGDVTLSLPQNIHSGASPTFAGLTLSGDHVNIGTEKTPASASATGTKGDICWDANYIYICIATDTWQRVAHATWT